MPWGRNGSKCCETRSWSHRKATSSTCTEASYWWVDHEPHSKFSNKVLGCPKSFRTFSFWCGLSMFDTVPDCIYVYLIIHLNVWKSIMLKPQSKWKSAETFKQPNIKILAKSNAKQHLLTHNREDSSTFNCSICRKSFFSRSALKLHFRVHSNVCPFKCEYFGCSENFR